ncbi:hypothetical protein Golax_024132 [Gossypium laxum]|uniref:Serine-rich protein-like protein n=1 Tax=Gossypium laxum TaxID=34288 RepID=A0A7J8ZB55_9ROSI|nr:hypothetical protein [Gossypium laxum]
MAASSRRSSGPVLRSHSPSSRFTSFYASQSHSPSSSSSSAFAYSSSGFSSRSTFFNQPRSTSPPRVNLHRNSSSASSSKQTKRTCMCSPTTHPGSFRCSLHKSFNTSHAGTGYAPSNRLNARRSAMTNSLVRIGGVEGDLVRRALSALIRPSSHQQRRREAFHPRPSRLSVMSSPRFSGDLRSSFGVTPRSVAVKSDSGDDVGDFGQRIRTDLS